MGLPAMAGGPAPPRPGQQQKSNALETKGTSMTPRATLPLAIAAALLASQGARAETAPALEEVFVTGTSQVFGNNEVSDAMKMQESSITSVNDLVDKLPGVSIQEGDTYGFDDWSTTIAIRGFQISLDDQQIGTTIDGMPNGNSNYGGGAKANRYIDTANAGTVEVSQGTADIASRSLEALGGTLNFRTDDPLDEARLRAQVAGGEYDAERYYVRYDSGRFAGDTRAWVSLSHQSATDWVNGIADNERDHAAAKLIASFDRVEFTAYASYDDTHEDNYQRLFTPEEFASNPEWDRLTDVWSGIPYVDQVYRQGWSTLRENTFGYLKADFDLLDGLRLSAGAYLHRNEGRGDWIPPYLQDVTDDQGGPQSEVTGGTTYRGADSLGAIYFVDGNGNALAPREGCVSSITFPYGGAGPEYDPACYAAGAIAVQSYRHTHYEKERDGFTLDADWVFDLGGLQNNVRAGLWYEDATRDEWRDWHKLTDTRVGIQFEDQPYWVQYNRSYPQETTKWYLEDKLDIAGFTFTLGAKQYLVEVERSDLFGESPDVAVDSDSDVLLSGGLLWQTPIDGLELFAGYAENFKAITDQVLERPESELDSIEPETAENMEAGLRYRGDRFFASFAYYNIDFENRIIFLSPETQSGPDYDIGTNGTFFNAGGIESDGFELSLDYSLTDELSLYSAYSYSDSTYLGTGDPSVDEAVGITPGNTVVGIPEDQLVVSLDWTRGQVQAGISAKYTGERYIRFDNSWAADDYTVTDLYLTFHGGEALGAINDWSVNFVVNNAFDEDYLGGIAGQGAWIGAPRTVSATFTVDL